MHSESVPLALFYPFPTFGALLDPTLKSGCVVQRVCEHTVSGLNKASDSKQAGQAAAAAAAVVDLFSSHARPTRPQSTRHGKCLNLQLKRLSRSFSGEHLQRHFAESG